MQDFRQLQVWQRAHQLNPALYDVTQKFPRSELFGLTSQIRRAGTSISANLAEGRGRGSDADFLRFVFMATGSACELESHLEPAKDLKFLSIEDFHSVLDSLTEVKRMLSELIAKLASHRAPQADGRRLMADS